MGKRAAFGTVDRLPSGRYPARYVGQDGKRRSRVFSTKADAWAWLSTQQADLVRKSWRAPEDSRRTLGATPTTTSPATTSGRAPGPSTTACVAATSLTTGARWRSGTSLRTKVRAWHTEAAKTTGPTALAQAYRLLRSLLGVAVDDEGIAASPTYGSRVVRRTSEQGL
jgi:hypothetical protein